MSSSKNSPGGVRVEQEIVRPAIRVEARSIAALPQWVMVQVRAMLDAQGLNPVIFDRALAQEALTFNRMTPLSDLAAADDARVVLAQLALRDLSLAQDPIAWLMSLGPIQDRSAAADSGGIYMQDYAADYVEPTYVGEQITTF